MPGAFGAEVSGHSARAGEAWRICGTSSDSVTRKTAVLLFLRPLTLPRVRRFALRTSPAHDAALHRISLRDGKTRSRLSDIYVAAFVRMSGERTTLRQGLNLALEFGKCIVVR